MALTVTNRRTTVFGNKRVATATVTFDSSYPTGGETLLASDFGLTRFEHVSTAISTDDGSVIAAWNSDEDTPTLQAFDPTTGAEHTDTTDLTDLAVDLFVIGS